MNNCKTEIFDLNLKIRGADWRAFELLMRDSKVMENIRWGCSSSFYTNETLLGIFRGLRLSVIFLLVCPMRLFVFFTYRLPIYILFMIMSSSSNPLETITL